MVGVYREKTGPVTVRRNDAASEPSGMQLLPPSKMSSWKASRLMDSIQSFRASLKTHFFTQTG